MGAPSIESSLIKNMKVGIVVVQDQNTQITCNDNSSTLTGSLWSQVSQELAHEPQQVTMDSNEEGTLRLIGYKKKKKRAMAAAAMVRKSLSKRRISMKRRSRANNYDYQQGSRRRGTDGIERRVKTLKELVPPHRDHDQSSEEEEGLDGLFRNTADYILSLQMRVRVMQAMVDLLSSSSSPSN